MKKLFIFLLIIFNVTVLANDKDPVIFLGKVLSEIKPFLIEKNDFFLEKVMNKYVDFNEIALWLAGKTLWTSASDLEKNNFLTELKALMLNTYKKTVYYYIDADIEFLKPKFNELFNNEKRIQIASVMQKNNKNISISYRLIKNYDSWLVFDILIEGISILKSLQSQYSYIIKSKGLVYATDQIKINNK